MSETFEEKTARNCRVQERYNELMREGKHGHYETMFRVVREEVELYFQLRQAAMPFAAHDWYDAELEDDSCQLTKHSGPVTVGHWRALRNALAATENQKSTTLRVVK